MANMKMIINRGNTLVMNYTNEDNSNPPQPISLSGATLYFTVKTSPGYDNSTTDSTAVWQIISSGNTGNTASFTSTAENTWQSPGQYYWDITIKYGDGSVITPLTGTLQIVGIATNQASV